MPCLQVHGGIVTEISCPQGNTAGYGLQQNRLQKPHGVGRSATSIQHCEGGWPIKKPVFQSDVSKIKPVFLTLPSLHHDEEMSHRQHDGYRVVGKPNECPSLFVSFRDCSSAYRFQSFFQQRPSQKHCTAQIPQHGV